MLRHLVHCAAACLEATAAHAPLPQVVVAQAAGGDRAARAKLRKRGIRDHAGLPFVLPGRKSFIFGGLNGRLLPKNPLKR